VRMKDVVKQISPSSRLRSGDSSARHCRRQMTAA
jgi:hypothetical protein